MKQQLFIAVLSVAACSAALQGAKVASWAMDEGTGTTTAESVTNRVSDPFPSGVTWSTTTPGPGSPSSLNFDGTTGAYVGTNLTAADLGIAGISPKTIAGWIKTSQSGSGYNGWIWGWSPGAGSIQGHDLRLCLHTNVLRFEVSSGYRQDLAGPVLTNGVWHFVAAIIGTNGDYTLGNVKFYIDGVLSSPGGNNPTVTINTDGTQSASGGATEIFLGVAGNVFTSSWNGQLDSFTVYNTALSQAELDSIRNAILSEYYSINPVPANQALPIDLPQLFSWEAVNAVNPSFDINIGTDSNCSNIVAGQSTGSEIFYTPPAGLLAYGTTYYWRVDITENTIEYPGVVWSFTTGGRVSGPVPADGIVAEQNVQSVSWTGDSVAASFNVYFGNEPNLIYVGNFTETTVSFDLLAGSLGLTRLPGGASYQWRVDTINASGDTMITGDVWTLILPEYTGLVEDFDCYLNTAAMQQVWTAGPGSTIEYDSLVNVMNYTYDCTAAPYQCQAQMIIQPSQDWQYEGWKSIQINFRGQENNALETLFVTLTDGTVSAMVNHPDTAAVTNHRWQTWDISLTEFIDAGVDLSNVTGLTIGFGDGAAPGGAGTAYLNDIQLYKSRCLSGYEPTGDINHDCSVDVLDINLLAQDWLKSDRLITATKPSAAGLAAHYAFNETSGSTAADSSANGYDATVSSAEPNTVWDTIGYSGGCIHLADIDTSILFPAALFSEIGQDVTIAFWVQGQASDWPDLVDNVEFSAGSVPIQSNVWDRTRWLMDNPDAYGSAWNHYAFVKNGGIETILIYQNGVLVSQNTQAAAMINGPFAEQTILSLASGISSPLKVDELYIYTYALSQEEILFLTEGPGAQKIQPLEPNLSTADLSDDGQINLEDIAQVAQGWMLYQLWPE